MTQTEQLCVSLYKRTQSIKRTAQEIGVSPPTVRKILITNGIYPTFQAEIVRDLQLDGLTPEEIAERLCVSVKTVQGYLPYTRGSYAAGEPSQNALRIRKSRERRLDNKTTL